MKKLLITLAAFTLLAACKEVEETPVDNTPQKSAVEGQWNFVSLNQSNGSIKIGGFEVSTYSSVSSEEQGTFTFNSDSTLSSSISYTNEQTVTTAGFPNTTTQNIPTTNVSGKYEFNKAAKTLKITTSTGLAQEGSLTTLSADTLVFEYPFELSVTQTGVTTVTAADAILKLGR